MIQIIPAIDLIEGRVVRLEQGDYGRRTVYSDKPEDWAAAFADAGVERLHLVDLDGAKSGSPKNLKALEKIASIRNLVIDYGGGLRTKADVERVLSSGAAMVNLGTIAAENTELIGSWAEEIGAEKFLIGADSKDGKISVSGWERSLDLEIFEFIERLSHYGLKRIFVTDISRDGVLKGPATGLYSEITRRFPEMELTASGGIRSIDDIKRLEKTGCKGAIVGRAIYEGKITLDDIKDYVGKKNHSMP